MSFSCVVGVVTVVVLVCKALYNVGHFLYASFLGPMLGHNLDLRKCGPWAVVTGSTDGIGKEYAKQLAAAGLDILLISRTPSKLEKVAEEIKNVNGSIKVKTIAVDFTDGQTIYPKLKAELSQLEIGILVNNVGMAIGFGKPFAEIENEQELSDIVNCNMTSMARMTHIVLPQMLGRKKGVIVNIGSVSSAFATPLATIYGATKAYVDKFSRDLGTEIKDSGVIVQVVHPGFVVTNMSKLRRSSMSAPNPETFVKAALKTIGLETRTAGYWFHKIQLYWGEMVRYFLPEIMGRESMKYMQNYRQKVLNRAAKAQ